MGAQAGGVFGELLRDYRLAAGLTQEALAERAGLGVRSVQALEGGQSRPQRDTVRRLAEALALGEEDRARLTAAGTPSPRRTAAPSPAAPPPPPSPAPRHNLPAALTALIGREAERGEVLALLAGARLVTLTGSGGVGKTRLALAVAEQLVGEYSDGVWLAELAALGEDRLVAQTALEALGTREEAGRPLLATLTDYLQERRLLLLLDNCEHLIDACAALAEAVLRRCPGVRVLATSREGLGVPGEHRYRVPSLTLPDLTHLPPPERLAESAAVALFVARARDRRADFALTAHNARAVAQVCAHLDGIPLAIELAAARVDSLGVAGIAARLDDRFRLLTGGPRTALPRQRTLRAALDWSYDLLTEPEQLLLDRLSVFAGGWTLAAAEAICAGDGVEQWEILDQLGSLVNKSLVQAEEAGGELRYGLLETVRQYGQERLAATSGLERVRDRHLAWHLARAEAAAPLMWGAEQAAWLDRLEAEHDNLRAALRWARERGAAEEGLRLAGALGRFWQMRGYLGEGLGWLEGALTGGAGGAAVRARALTEAGELAAWQGVFGRAAALLEEGLALYRALGDTRGIALALTYLGTVALRQGDYGRAIPLQEEALALFRARADPVGIAFSQCNLAWIACVRGEYALAASRLEEGMACCREAGYEEGVGRFLLDLAYVMVWRGAHARATALAEEGLALMREIRTPAGIAWALINLGRSLLAQGEEERATSLLEESLALVRETGNFWGIPDALACLGWAAYLRGEHEQAAAMQEEALARYRQVNYRPGIIESLAGLGCLRQALGEYGRASACLREALALGREIGARGPLAEALEGMAWLAVAEGQAGRAARLGGAAEALREALGAPLRPALRAAHDVEVQAMQSALGEAACAAAWAEGRALPLEEAVALALEAQTGG